MSSNPAPIFTSLNPSSGSSSGGTAVTITGQNFVNGCSVKFGGVDAVQVTFVSSTQVVAVTPPQAVGPATVSLINPDQKRFVAEDAFTYTPAPSPVITSINPTSGPQSGDTLVTIFGQNFKPNCIVMFGGVDAQLVNFFSSSQISVRKPAQ